MLRNVRSSFQLALSVLRDSVGSSNLHQVNGLAMGGSLNFALLLHDFVISAESAKFRYPSSRLALLLATRLG